MTGMKEWSHRVVHRVTECLARFIQKNPRLFVALFNIIYIAVLFLLSKLEWPLPGDATTYAELAAGVPAEPPFSYRLLIPWLVSLFPVEVHKWVFLSLTTANLVLCSVLLFEYLMLKQFPLKYAYLGVLVWMSSWAFQYHLLNFGAVDPAVLTVVVAYLVLLEKNLQLYTAPLLFVGFFVKEAVLFLFPLVLLEALHGRNWRNFILLAAVGVILMVITILRPATYSIQTIIDVFAYNRVSFTQGPVFALIDFFKEMAVYAFRDFGIILVSGILGFMLLSRKDKARFLYLLSAFLGMSFIATDWERMMFLLFPVIILAGIIPMLSTNQFLVSRRVDTLAICLLVATALAVGPATWIFAASGVLLVNVLCSCIFALFALRYSHRQLRQSLLSFLDNKRSN